MRAILSYFHHAQDTELCIAACLWFQVHRSPCILHELLLWHSIGFVVLRFQFMLLLPKLTLSPT